MDVALCTKCGTERPATDFYWSNGKMRRPCKHCFKQWHRGRYIPKDEANDAPRDCAWCGASFQPKQRKPSTFCSRPCKENSRHAGEAAARVASKPTDRICIQCATPLPQTMRADAKFCSAVCNSAAHALQRKLRARGGINDEPGYVRIEIAERDRWTCGICGDAVPKDKRWPEPLAGSLDHIIPVSQGGTSDRANLRLTHLVCNLRRRDGGGGEQLALLG